MFIAQLESKNAMCFLVNWMSEGRSDGADPRKSGATSVTLAVRKAK